MLESDPGLFDEPQTVRDDRRPRVVGTVVPGQQTSARRCRCAPCAARCTGPLHGQADEVAGPGDARELGTHFRSLRVRRAVRIVYDVSPLSHPLTGVGNYMRGSLAGLVEAPAGEHEIVAFAPTSLARAEGDPTRARRARRRAPARAAAVLAALARRLEPARPARRSSASSATFDVFHFSDWMYPPQAGGVRATTVHDLVPLRFPEWVTPKTRRCTARSTRTRPARADLVFVNSEYTGRDVVERLGVGAGAGQGRLSRRRRTSSGRTGERADLGRPYVLTVATLEPRKNLETLVAAHRLLGDDLLLAVAGGTGWGDQPELRGAEHRPARLRLRR